MMLNKQMTTRELLDHVKASEGETIEAALCAHGLRATHWFHFWQSRIYHEGIDGVRERTSRRQLLELYPRAIWNVEAAWGVDE